MRSASTPVAGRGVTAARLLALSSIHDGKYATACPFYGAGRRGAPIVSFVRIDDNLIKVYSRIKNPMWSWYLMPVLWRLSMYCRD
jgi:Pyruvate/2-oxoacid:ferredoxin oxidoreductase gamma subunit